MPRKDLLLEYPADSKPGDWFHMFNRKPVKGDVARNRELNRSIDQYIKSVLGHSGLMALIGHFNAPDLLDLEVGARAVMAVNRLTKEMTEGIRPEIIIDMVAQAHQEMNIATAKRIYPAYLEKWRLKAKAKFVDEYLSDEAKLAIDLAHARRLANLVKPGRYPEVPAEVKLTDDQEVVETANAWSRKDKIDQMIEEASQCRLI